MYKNYKIIYTKDYDLKSIINLHLKICKISYKYILKYDTLIFFHNEFIKERKKILYNKYKEINLIVKYRDNKTIAFIDVGPISKYEDLDFLYSENVLEIKKLFLHPYFWGKGLSKHLFIKSIEIAKNKYPNYYILIVLSFKDNKNANYFYEKMGGKKHQILKYKIYNTYHDVICYKWNNFYKILELK